jgi:CubicO group peptidase (beta-lactamase class C family)
MKSSLLALALLCVPSFAQADLASQIDAVIQKEVASSSFQGNVLVTGKDGEIFSKSYGLAEMELSVPNTRATKFRIGSISKQFTATAILTLHVAGTIKDLHDPVANYVPVPDSFKPVTLHELLTHTAGLEHDPSLIRLTYGMYHSLGELFAGITTDPFLPDHAPGGAASYSNAGFEVLAYLVEKLSGMPYADYLKKAVFDPAGLTNTLDLPNDWTFVPGRAAGYWFTDGEVTDATGFQFSNLDGAGSVISTVDDLIRWDAELKSGTHVLPETEKALLFQKYSTLPDANLPYGYGWIIDQWKGHKLIWHNGGVNGFSADFARYVDDGVTIVTMTNAGQLPDSLTRIREGIAALVLTQR